MFTVVQLLQSRSRNTKQCLDSKRSIDAGDRVLKARPQMLAHRKQSNICYSGALSIRYYRAVSLSYEESINRAVSQMQSIEIHCQRFLQKYSKI